MGVYVFARVNVFADAAQRNPPPASLFRVITNNRRVRVGKLMSVELMTAARAEH